MFRDWPDNKMLEKQMGWKVQHESSDKTSDGCKSNAYVQCNSKHAYQHATMLTFKAEQGSTCLKV